MENENLTTASVENVQENTTVVQSNNEMAKILELMEVQNKIIEGLRGEVAAIKNPEPVPTAKHVDAVLASSRQMAEAEQKASEEKAALQQKKDLNGYYNSLRSRLERDYSNATNTMINNYSAQGKEFDYLPVEEQINSLKVLEVLEKARTAPRFRHDKHNQMMRELNDASLPLEKRAVLADHILPIIEESMAQARGKEVNSAFAPTSTGGITDGLLGGDENLARDAQTLVSKISVAKLQKDESKIAALQGLLQQKKERARVLLNSRR